MINYSPYPSHRIWKSLQDESQYSQDIIHHDCCPVFVHDWNLSHHSTLLWHLFDTPKQLHILLLGVLSVCARAFSEIVGNATRNVIGMQSCTTSPWQVLILWSPDQMIFHPSHLTILVFHIHIIIPKKVSCQFLEPIAENTHIYSSLPCWLSPAISSIASSLFYTSSLSWFYFQSNPVLVLNENQNFATILHLDPLIFI
jgi:hypothetical protein